MSATGAIEVDYSLPAGADAHKHAQIIAIGQTAGTWSDRFEHRAAQLSAHLAEVLDVRALDDGRRLATIRFPLGNVEGDVPSLLTMIFGKYSMAGAAKVVDVRLPPAYGLEARLGISGIREALGVRDRPLVMAIFKPALGLTASDHAEILAEVAAAGLDVIKDDEILADIPDAPTVDRVRACAPVLEKRLQESGRPLLYAVNLTGHAATIVDRARTLIDAGANAFLLNVLSYGFAVLESLVRADLGVPIFVHPSLAGALCGAPEYGFAYSVVLGTLMAHAGADAVLYPAHYGSLPFDPVEEHRIRDALRARNVFPVPSAGIHPGIVPAALRDYGVDVILNAGTGIMDHPDGPGDGVRAFFDALAHHRAGGTFEPDAVTSAPLRRALEKWGSS